MMKQFTCFKFKELNKDDLIKVLFNEDNIFKDFSSTQQLETSGFVDFHNDYQVLDTNNVVALKYKIEKKNVPTSYVKEKLKEKVKELEAKESRKLAKKEVKEIKEGIIEEVLARAFTSVSYMITYIDFNKKIIYFDNKSDKKINKVQRKIAESFLGYNPKRFMTKEPFSSTIYGYLSKDWFNSDENQSELNLDSKCVLVLPNDATIQFKNLNLLSEDVMYHLNEDKKNTRFISQIGLTMGDNVSFSVNENMQFSNIHIENIQKKKDDDVEQTDKQFDESNLIIEINAMNDIVFKIVDILGGESESMNYSIDAESPF